MYWEGRIDPSQPRADRNLKHDRPASQLGRRIDRAALAIERRGVWSAALRVRAGCLAVGLGVLAVPACESTLLLGTGCKDAICPLATGADTCLVRATDRSVVHELDAAAPDSRLRGVCLPAPLPRDSHGLVNAAVHWVLPRIADAPAGVPVHCSERAFLHPISVAFDARYRASYPGQEVCDVDQLPMIETPDAGIALPADAGFFYDDSSVELTKVCSATQPQRVAFSESAQPPERVIVVVVAGETLSDAGGVCRLAPGNSQLGRSCLPSLEDYDVSQAVLQTQSEGCEGRACLAYHMEGNVADDCQPSSTPPFKHCLSKENRAKRAFCTCRCDAPAADAERCECGDAFKCVPVFEAGDPAIVGSYCVPNDLSSTE